MKRNVKLQIKRVGRSVNQKRDALLFGVLRGAVRLSPFEPSSICRGVLVEKITKEDQKYADPS